MKSITRRPLISTLVGVLGITTITLGASSVLARPHGGPFSGGGDITIADVEARHAQRMTAADTDGNGTISRAEFLAARPEGREGPGGPRGFRGRHGGPGMKGPHHADIDPAAMEEAVFGKLDADKSGAIERGEFNHEALGAAHHAAMRETMFEKLDANADGMLSGEELPNPVEHLKKLDTNADGIVTRDERRAGRSGHGDSEGKPAGAGA